MFINSQITLAQNFQGFIPKSKYKGPILELTESDKEQIANIQKQITSLECNIYEYTALHKSKKRTSDTQERTYKAYCKYVQRALNELREKIKEVKVHRLNIQKAIKSGKKLSFEQLV